MKVKKMTKNNNLSLTLLALSFACVAASTFGFSFVYSENPTGSLFDSIKFSQLFQTKEGEVIPQLVEELRLFCIVGFGGFCASALFYGLRVVGKNFRGMTLLFILSLIVGVGTFLAMRLGLSQMISKGASFGVGWYFVYAAFAALAIGYWFGKKVPNNVDGEQTD